MALEKQVDTPKQNKEQHHIKFEEMQLKVGDNLQLKLSTRILGNSDKGKSKYITGILIGYIKDVTLLVMLLPRDQHILEQRLLDQDQIQVRLFSGQSAYNFTVYIDQIIKNSPVKYMHLSFPEKIVGQPIRKSRRIKTYISVTIAGNSASAMITDLSATGAKICTQNSLGDIGTKLDLSFSAIVHEEEKKLELPAVIRSVNQIKNSNSPDKILSGIEFNGPNPEQSFILRSLVYQELVEQPMKTA